MKELGTWSLVERRAAAKALVLAQQRHLRHLVHRRLVERPEGRCFLVVSAHPDDAAIGCGGTLLKLKGQASVHSLVLTDGRAAAEAAQEEAMARARAAEERRVAEELSLASLDYLAWNERTFRVPEHQSEQIARIGEILARRRPDVVLLPDLSDQHPDHRYAAFLVAQALRAAGDPVRVLSYEAWSLTPPGLVVDITTVLEQKKALVRRYASQIALLDYVFLVEEMGRLHAPLAGPGALAAEVFCPYRCEDFLEAVAALDLGRVEDTPTVNLTPPE